MVVVPASTLRTPSCRRLRRPPVRRACSRISWVLPPRKVISRIWRVHLEELEDADPALVALEPALATAHGAVDRPALDVALLEADGRQQRRAPAVTGCRQLRQSRGRGAAP